MSVPRSISAVLVLVLIATACGSPAEEDSGTELDRTVPLDGVSNTRDLGGLRTKDGHTVRSGQIIRSGEIDDIDDVGMTRLDELGVSAIIDLRTTKEATANPAHWPEGKGPDRYNFPLMENESAMIDDMHALISSGSATGSQTDAMFFDAFSYIATDYTSEIRSVFDILLKQPNGQAVLYHCSGGKDRTGITTALVLSALGVTRDEIEADFMMSNQLNDADNAAAAIASQVNSTRGTNMSAQAVWPTLGVRKAYLDEFYRSVEEEYGSVDDYLRDGLGLTTEELEVLRARYLN